MWGSSRRIEEVRVQTVEAARLAVDAKAAQVAHEAVCAERWRTMNEKMDGVHRRMDKDDEDMVSRDRRLNSFMQNTMRGIIILLLTVLGTILMQLAIKHGYM